MFPSSKSGCKFSPDWLNVQINESSVNKNVRQICYLTKRITGDNKIAWLLKAITFIDLTTLNSTDTSSNVETVCKKATASTINNFSFNWSVPLHAAAVCVYPSKVLDAKKILTQLGKADVIKIASVAGGFPSGQYPLSSKLEEIKYAIKAGACEIDIVIDRSLALSQQWEQLFNELKSIREACYNSSNSDKSEICLKTILSTGELYDLNGIYKASMVAMMAGADFIKTSTGKEEVNASLPVGVVMCRAIKDFLYLTGKKVGIKPAGGIKTAKEALEWMVLIKEELGEGWMTSNYFRIGASSLFDNIINEINRIDNKIVNNNVSENSTEENSTDESSSDEIYINSIKTYEDDAYIVNFDGKSKNKYDKNAIIGIHTPISEDINTNEDTDDEKTSETE